MLFFNQSITSTCFFCSVFFEKGYFSVQASTDSVSTAKSAPISQKEGVTEANLTNDFSALGDSGNDNFSFTWFYIKTLLILGIISAILFFIFKFLRKSINQTTVENQFYQVVFNFPLAANKNIMIVKIISHFYILATTQDNVQLLEKITDKETIDILVIESDKESGQSLTFVDKVFDVLKKKGYQKNMINPLETTKNIRNKIKDI